MSDDGSYIPGPITAAELRHEMWNRIAALEAQLAERDAQLAVAMGALAEAKSQLHNLPRSATADSIETIIDRAIAARR